MRKHRKRRSFIWRPLSSKSILVRIFNPDSKFDNLRKKSIKNEFQLAKDLLKIQIAEENEDMDTEEPEETAKNTMYNKQVGQMHDDDDDDDDDSDS